MGNIPAHVLTANPGMVASLTRDIEVSFGVPVPKQLVTHWETVGFGYFDDYQLFVFPPIPWCGRTSLIEWNKRPFWSSIFPTPLDGGPIIFADNCFGDQFGYRWESGSCKFIVFTPSTFESFLISDGGESFFSSFIADGREYLDSERLGRLKSSGLYPSEGRFLAPKLSPLLGGEDTADNFARIDPEKFMLSAVEAAKLRRMR